MGKLTVKHAKQWNRDCFYPDPDSEVANLLMEFMEQRGGRGRVGFTMKQMTIAKKLGFEIEIKPFVNEIPDNF